MKKISTPFYPNLKDDLHCFQAALKMALAVLDTSRGYSYKVLEKSTGFKKNRVTWDMRALLWLAGKGMQIKKVTPFDYAAFAERGSAYLKSIWRPDVYEFQRASSNLSREQTIAKKLIKARGVELLTRRPTMRLLESHIKSGWIAILHLDVSLFDKKKDYSPHSILICDVSARHVIFHDPGLPPEPFRRVSRATFVNALHHAELILLRRSIPR